MWRTAKLSKSLAHLIAIGRECSFSPSHTVEFLAQQKAKFSLCFSSFKPYIHTARSSKLKKIFTGQKHHLKNLSTVKISDINPGQAS